MQYGEQSYDDTLNDRVYDPYVATPQGFARKIGPRSRYGMNPKTGDQVPDSQRQKTPTRLGSTPSRLGTPMAQTESRFATSMREADDQTAANNAYLAQKSGVTAPAKTSVGKRSLKAALSGARASALGKRKWGGAGFTAPTRGNAEDVMQ